MFSALQIPTSNPQRSGIAWVPILIAHTVHSQRAKSRGLCGDGGYLVEGNQRGNFSLKVKLASTLKLRGILPMDSSGIYRRFPPEFIGNFGGFMGDKTVVNFKGNPRSSQKKITRNLQRNREKFKGYPHFLCFLLLILFEIHLNYSLHVKPRQ